MKILNSLFGLILGTAFAGGGLMIAMETVVPTYQAWRTMQHWHSASGTLLEVTGSRNATAAKYRYRIADIDYQNDRVYVAQFKDNIGSYHQELTRQLQRLKRKDQAVPIWYNPDDPAQAVIDRDMRWGLFALMSGFCSIFILLGLAICYAGLHPAKIGRRRHNKPSLLELKRQWRRSQAAGRSNVNFPDFVRQETEYHQRSSGKARVDWRHASNAAPWLDKKEWRQNRMRSNAKSSLYFIWGFAIVFSAISLPLLVVLIDELKQDHLAAALGLLFPVASLFLLCKAWKMTREWHRFGIIELQMDPFPGSIGGHVGGSLLLSQVSDAHSPYNVLLECVHTYVSGTGDNRSRREKVKWAEQGIAKAEMTGRGVRLEFRFTVPDGLPEADIEQRGDYYYWRLGICAEIDGITLNRQYNIPVFNTCTASRFISHDNSAQAEEIRQEKTLASQAAIGRGDFASTPLAKAFRYQNLGNGHHFYFPMFRNRLPTLFALIFAGCFGFATYMINQEFSADGILGVVMLIFSLPFALVGLVATIAVIYLSFNNLSVKVTGDKISALRKLLFIPVQYRSLSRNELREITIKSSGSTGQGVNRVKHYQLVAHGNNRQQFTIAEGIDGEELAEQLKGFISESLGKG